LQLDLKEARAATVCIVVDLDKSAHPTLAG
jgi:hypothetical protein